MSSQSCDVHSITHFAFYAKVLGFFSCFHVFIYFLPWLRKPENLNFLSSKNDAKKSSVGCNWLFKFLMPLLGFLNDGARGASLL